MSYGKFSDFTRGLTSGALIAGLGSVVTLYAMNMLGVAVISFPDLPLLHRLLDEAWINLRLSLPFFVLVSLAFLLALRSLQRMLTDDNATLAIVIRAEQMVDLCITLFFGIGVIWTAIGMRSALLYSLGDPAQAAEAGAFAILQRMVDGGILLALSTTIVGGIGGYLMRLFKMLTVGGDLHEFHERREQEYAVAVLAGLQQIDSRLAILLDDKRRVEALDCIEDVVMKEGER